MIDGPFAEAKELIAGFWLIQVKSREEAIEWALRVPCRRAMSGVGLDVWRVYDPTDTPDPSLSPEAAHHEAALRERLEDADHPDRSRSRADLRRAVRAVVIGR